MNTRLPLSTALLAALATSAAAGLSGYLDLHTHLACFEAPPTSAVGDMPCYVGEELVSSPKFRFYPQYFSLRPGEHFVRSPGTRLPRFQEEWINRQPYLDATGVARPRTPAQRYDPTTRNLYAFEHLSALLQQSETVEAAVVLAMDQVWDVVEVGGQPRGVPDPGATPFYLSNEFVLQGIQWLKQRFGKNNLLLGASVHPYRYPAAEVHGRLAELQRRGAVLVKLIASTHRFHAASDCPGQEGVNHCRSPGDSEAVHREKARRLAAFYRALAALDLPLLIHVGEEGSFGGGPEEDFTGAYKVLQPLRAGVRVVVAHAASRGTSPVYAPELSPPTPGAEVSQYDQLRMIVDAFRDRPERGLLERLFVDISVLPSVLHSPVCVGERKDDLYQIMEVDHDRYWKGRLLFGTDYPLNHALFRPKYCFTSPAIPGNGRYRQLFRRTGHLDPTETQRAYREGRHFDHEVLMQRAFGVPEAVFRASERFLPGAVDELGAWLPLRAPADPRPGPGTPPDS